MRIKEVIKEYPIPYYPDYPMTPWQRPWDIVWTSDSSAGTGNDVGVSADSNSYIQINASEAKYNTPGTYVLSNGTIKNI